MSLKARLLFVSWIKVDGKLVYKAEPKPTDADDRDVRNTVPATSAEPQAAVSEPARPAAKAADEATADAPALEVAESF